MTDSGTAAHSARRADVERNRAAIIEAALAVLAHDTLAPMEAVAAEAGLSRVTLYRHFGSREALISAIRDEALRQARASMAEANLSGLSASEALRLTARRVLPLGVRFRIIVQDADAPGLLAERTAIFQPLAAAIVAGQQSGELRTDLPAAWILDAFAELLILAVRRSATEPATSPTALADRVCDTLLEGIAAGDGVGPGHPRRA